MPDDQISSPDDFAATDPAEVAMTRRRLLIAAGLTAAGLVTAGAAGAAGAATRRTTTTAKRGAAAGSCTVTAPETAGPFPGDGSNGVNVLAQDGIVRTDMRSSLGTSSAIAAGVPLALRLTLRSTSSGCAPMAGAALYAWHCDKDGGYSMYSPEVADENYLRAVGVADATGLVQFITVFPGAYPGRYPHVHFEVYRSVTDATGSGSPIATSQLAFPESACTAAYQQAGYESSRRAFPRTPLSRDGVFRDGVSTQMATMTGTVAKGLTAALTINV